MPVTAGLLFGNADGTGRGRFCEGETCNGSGPNELDLPQINAAMAAELDPGIEISAERAQELAALVGADGEPLLNRIPDDQRPLSRSEYDALVAAVVKGEIDEAVLDTYAAAEEELDLSATQLHAPHMAFLDAAVTEIELAAEYGELAPEIDELNIVVTDALDDDGNIDDAEWAEIEPLRDSIDEQAPGFLEEWAPAQEMLSRLRYAGWTQAQGEEAAWSYVGENPELIEQLVEGYEASDGPPTRDHQELAIQAVVAAQKAVGDAQSRMFAELGARTEDLNSRIDMYNQFAANAEAGGGATPGESMWLRASTRRSLGSRLRSPSSPGRTRTSSTTPKPRYGRSTWPTPMRLRMRAGRLTYTRRTIG